MSAAQPAPDRRAVLGGSLGLAAAVAASAAPALADVEHPDAVLLALGEEMDRAEVRDRELLAICIAAGNDRKADLAWEAQGDVCKAIKDRIATLPATTLAGLAVKARGVAYIYRDDFSAEGMELTGTTDVRLIWSILADLAPDHVVAPVAAPEAA